MVRIVVGSPEVTHFDVLSDVAEVVSPTWAHG
jgi:hypothetical protein